MIGLKDFIKFLIISIISCCAVFVCSLFLNFNTDLALLKSSITSPEVMMFYDAQVMMGKVISAVSGCCLLLTSIVMLFFTIKNYIDTHKKELGTLKALGYSNFKIAKSFWVFGLSIFVGTAIGHGLSYTLSSNFYSAMNADKVLPEVQVHFNPTLLIWLVVVPTVAFGILSILYGMVKLRQPTLDLLREKEAKYKTKRLSKGEKPNTTFLQSLKRSTVKSRYTLVFFIWFSAFCYSAMIQMSMVMDDLNGGAMFTAIVLVIGIVLALVILLLAITTVVSANKKHISIMKAFGYSFKECSSSILNGYRPIAYIGFALGTVYQYVIINIMVGIFAKTTEAIPEFKFDFIAFVVTLVTFAIVYEVTMYCCSMRIKNMSVKEVMMS